ncbi:MAG: tetratricopeptide repeat protein, partial [Candidatus Hermodarchaeota archaeon]
MPKLLAIPDLRFEYLIEAFRDNYDKDLTLLNYFEEVIQPNVIHQYLAQMLKQGHFVMTTNFDTLIERAVGLEEDQLRIVITQHDFETYADPQAANDQGLWVVYKLHGSVKNVKTGEDTKTSVVTTLDALGKHREGQLGVEVFKRPVFNQIGRGRTLIVMGYSGGDDLDIIPTVLQMVGLKRIIWIQHQPLGDQPASTTVPVLRWVRGGQPSSRQVAVEDQVLSSLATIPNVEVFKVMGHTATVLLQLQGKSYSAPPAPGRHDLVTWLPEHFLSASEMSQTRVTIKTFYTYNLYPDALEYATRAYTLATQQKDDQWQANALIWQANIYKKTGEPQKALKNYQQSYDIYERLENWGGMATALGNMGNIYAETGEPQKALEYFQKSYDIHERLENWAGMATTWSNMGIIYAETGKPQKGLKHFQQSYDIHERLGNWAGMASALDDMGIIYAQTGKSQKALEYFQKSYDIHERLGNWGGMATALDSMGNIHRQTGKPQKALEYYQQSYDIHERLENWAGMATTWVNMGNIYAETGEPQKALEYFQKSYDIHERL